MTFAVFVPSQAEERAVPVLWYLSGLTCTHANVMEKGEYRRLASELGLMVVCPDTSPRGSDVPDENDNWQFGSGAGFYVDATQTPYDRHYQMYSYVSRELPTLIASKFPADMERQGIFGHSMGGHGALTLALRNPGQFRSVSAFAPIVNPMEADWSVGAFEKYLGRDKQAWRAHDACALVEDDKTCPHILIDQGSIDGFLTTGLMPERFEKVCADAGQPLTLRMQEGYDHSYYFISTFMNDHLQWHSERLSV
jgi:S-formylglutathione hydrolase